MDYKKTGAEIRKIRIARGITQKQLGAAIGRSESSIAKYEQGLVEIPSSVLMDVAEFLGVDGIDLLGLAKADPKPTPFSAAFKWLESLGYKVLVYEEEDYRSVVLCDMDTHRQYPISDALLHNLVDNVASYTRFQISEMIKKLPSEGNYTPTPEPGPETPQEGE